MGTLIFISQLSELEPPTSGSGAQVNEEYAGLSPQFVCRPYPVAFWVLLWKRCKNERGFQ